jgi:hypothetical protein
MQKWEYNILAIPEYIGKGKIESALAQLDKLGKNGWELVSSNMVWDHHNNQATFFHHFKRPVEWNTVASVMTS